MKKAAFIEFNVSHSECIYSHLLYLKTAGYHVEFICNKALKDRVTEIKKIADKTSFINVGLPYRDINCKYILAQNFDKVIIGSSFCYGDKDVIEKLPAEYTSDFFGVLHNLNHVGITGLINPRHRRYVERVNKFFVLADYLAANAPQRNGLAFAPIPLIFQPDYPPISIMKPNADIWIAIPGTVEFKRRDYMALIPPQGEKYAKNIKFILLGWDRGEKNTAFRNTLKDNGIEHNFIFFDNYVEGGAFQSWIRKCDYIMPLIHEKCDDFRDYLSVKITGNLNVALTYRKPMLCDAAFSAIADYAAHCIFYERDELCRLVNNLGKADIKKFYDKEFERTHSLEALSERYHSFLLKR